MTVPTGIGSIGAPSLGPDDIIAASVAPKAPHDGLEMFGETEPAVDEPRGIGKNSNHPALPDCAPSLEKAHAPTPGPLSHAGSGGHAHAGDDKVEHIVEAQSSVACAPNEDQPPASGKLKYTNAAPRRVPTWATDNKKPWEVDDSDEEDSEIKNESSDNSVSSSKTVEGGATNSATPPTPNLSSTLPLYPPPLPVMADTLLFPTGVHSDTETVIFADIPVSKNSPLAPGAKRGKAAVSDIQPTLHKLGAGDVRLDGMPGLEGLLGSGNATAFNSGMRRVVREGLKDKSRMIILFRGSNAKFRTPLKTKQENQLRLSTFSQRLTAWKDSSRSVLQDISVLIFLTEKDSPLVASDGGPAGYEAMKVKFHESVCGALRPDLLINNLTIPADHGVVRDPAYAGRAFWRLHLPRLVTTYLPPFDPHSPSPPPCQSLLGAWHATDFKRGDKECKAGSVNEGLPALRDSTTWLFKAELVIPQLVEDEDEGEYLDAVRIAKEEYGRLAKETVGEDVGRMVKRTGKKGKRAATQADKMAEQLSKRFKGGAGFGAFVKDSDLTFTATSTATSSALEGNATSPLTTSTTPTEPATESPHTDGSTAKQGGGRPEAAWGVVRTRANAREWLDFETVRHTEILRASLPETLQGRVRLAFTMPALGGTSHALPN
ncbi:hypothetical protein IAT38_004815 [Cryptococcus sp. DSM 104549]